MVLATEAREHLQCVGHTHSNSLLMQCVFTTCLFDASGFYVDRMMIVLQMAATIAAAQQGSISEARQHLKWRLCHGHSVPRTLESRGQITETQGILCPDERRQNTAR